MADDNTPPASRGRASLRAAALVFAASLAAGCAMLNKKPAAPPAKAPASAKPKPVPKTDPAAQKASYDLGMKHYSQEKYPEARKAWQEAVRLGPATPLGKQAQEHLRKVEQVLKTLQEIDKQ